MRSQTLRIISILAISFGILAGCSPKLPFYPNWKIESKGPVYGFYYIKFSEDVEVIKNPDTTVYEGTVSFRGPDQERASGEFRYIDYHDDDSISFTVDWTWWQPHREGILKTFCDIEFDILTCIDQSGGTEWYFQAVEDKE
jgi:hypothetical protein